MPPTLTAYQEPALYLGLLIVATFTLLSLFWVLLQIIGWFRPKGEYATKTEVAELRIEVRLMSNTMQAAIVDLHRAIGRLEGINVS